MTVHSTEPGTVGERQDWLVLATVMAGSIAAMLPTTMINVAVPDLSARFGIGQGRAQWVATGHMLAMTLSMLLTPWLLQRFGLRRIYTWAILALVAGGVLGGVSANFPMLLSMRVLEGIAAGVIQPLPAIVILSSFPAALQARALGFSGVGVVVVPAIGPWIGGLLIEQMGWRSVFFASAPFGLVALALIRRHLPVGRPGGARPSLDWKGLLLISAAAIALLNALVHARDGHAGALLLVAGGVACGIAFIWVQLRGGPGGLLDMRLFRDRQFGMGALVSFTYGMGLFGSTYLLPVYMQLGLLYPPGLAGLVMLPAGLALGLTIALAGRLAARWAPNVIIAAGLALLSAAVASMAAIPSGPALATMIGLVCLGRVGLGAVFPALTLGAMRGLDRSLVSQGAAAINFLRQLGGVIGIGTVGIVLDWRLQVHALPGGLAGGAGSLRAFNETLLVVAAICAVSVVAALRMKPAGKGG